MAKNQTKRQKKVSASLDVVNFDENIFYNILRRLDATTLYNLRIVCKQWYELISDPGFANSNFPNGENGIMIQIHGRHGYSLRFLKMVDGKVTVDNMGMHLEEPACASCNGLLLARDLPEHGDLSIGNPFAKKGMKLPLDTCALSLHAAIGFTYVKETREYKVVCQMIDEEANSIIYMIITVGSNEWRPVNGPQYVSSSMKEPLSVNGSVYALIPDQGGREFLFLINTATETSHSIGVPYHNWPIHMAPGDYNLVDQGGVMSLVAGFEYKGYVELWNLNERPPEEADHLRQKFYWTRTHLIPPRIKRFGRMDFLHFVVPIGSLCNGQFILFVHAATPDSPVYMADLKTKQVKMVPKVKANRYHCLPHFNSLISWESVQLSMI